MRIHKEGRRLLSILLLLLVSFNFVVAYGIKPSEQLLNLSIVASIVLYLAILQFFRNPHIVVSNNGKHILAPADGKVVVIEKTHENEFFDDERIQISIFMSPTNVHVNRAPLSGIVKYFKYHPGRYRVAWHPKSSTDNERTTMVLTSQNGIDVLVRQIAGAMARRIKWYVKEGSSIEQGHEYGFIKFGSRVDVFLPLDTTVLVHHGTKTKGGRTILAELAE